MTVLSVTREFNFEMAHHLPGHDGLCINIHGHSYRLVVSLKGTPLNEIKNPKDGMVVDFADLKAIVKEQVLDKLDHALVLRDSLESQTVKKSLSAIGVEKVLLLKNQPTCENLLLFIKDELLPNIPNNLEVTRLQLKETATTSAEWQA